jgi:hypothetical protein
MRQKHAWWEWWLAPGAHSFVKKTGLMLILFLISSILLSHPAASTLPILSWPANIVNQTFYPAGENIVSWTLYGKEYVISILLLLSLLVLPGIRAGSVEEGELELETLTPPAPEFDIPASVLDEFTERLEKSLFSPEPMKESIEKLGKF